MRALLPLYQSDLDQEDFHPLSPSLILEDGEQVAIYSDGYFFKIAKTRLEEIVEQDVRDRLGLSAKERVFLRDIQQPPTDDLTSPEFQNWAREWWKQSMKELRHELLLASAV